jgi:hypothetical protein
MGYKKTTKYKGITRVDRNAGYHDDGRRIKATHGYFVRVTWKGQTYRKFFSDAVHGDRLGALEAAKDWRISKEREIGKPRSERQVIGIPHTTTGIVGIRKIVSGPWGHEAYEANWVNPDGSIGRTSYSIVKNGDREALKLALEARKRGEDARRNSRFSGRPKRMPRDNALPIAPSPAPTREPADDWFDSVDASRFEPPSFSLPSFAAPPQPRLEDYDGT